MRKMLTQRQIPEEWQERAQGISPLRSQQSHQSLRPIYHQISPLEPFLPGLPPRTYQNNNHLNVNPS